MRSDHKKKIRIIAGPNGSGKTTLFHSIKNNFNPGVFINADYIEKTLIDKGYIDLKEFEIQPSKDAFLQFITSSNLLKKAEKEGYKIRLEISDAFIVSKSENTCSYEAALIASFIREQLIKLGQNFSFETVLSHPSKNEEIQFAKDNGYLIYLYYVSVESPIISQARVETRVQKGGHSVNPEKLISRYYNTLENLANLIPLVHRAYFFDNSGKEYVLLSERLPNGNLKEHEKKYPAWFLKYVVQRIEV